MSVGFLYGVQFQNTAKPVNTVTQYNVGSEKKRNTI